MENSLPGIATHIVLIDILKYFFIHILIPITALGLRYFTRIHKKILYSFQLIKKKIETKKIQQEFDNIFANEQQNKLRQQYIVNALTTALSKDRDQRITAIKQLSQFREPIVIDGLLKLLCNEDDLAFRSILIAALHKASSN